ncbi:MAG: bifunctional demethylmenaquinone methyltransferase/2-methoxy-6-polyprenyl-1,4-benzoquinol methylase UbiE [bacterium]|nr:bifunctional demethylmenaquinone methyltransferase/2-methoxy-6-polyprenyl-1,4-benzoquinol methylase UbiE [bacterium]
MRPKARNIDLHSELEQLERGSNSMVESPQHRESWSKQESWAMFDRIAKRYDLLNRLLSFGRDRVWRKRVAEYLPQGDEIDLLDLATGTTDLLISLCRSKETVKYGVGLDMSAEMLRVGERKIVTEGLADRCALVHSDAQALPFASNSFDAVTIAFGIRNVPDVPKALKEITRVLKSGGRAIVLEFSLPKNRLIRQLYLFYFRQILPRVGSIISGDAYAYRYLNRTVETFPYGEEFCRLLRQAGMNIAGHSELTFGVASIYAAEKPGTNADQGSKRN